MSNWAWLGLGLAAATGVIVAACYLSPSADPQAASKDVSPALAATPAAKAGATSVVGAAIQGAEDAATFIPRKLGWKA